MGRTKPIQAINREGNVETFESHTAAAEYLREQGFVAATSTHLGKIAAAVESGKRYCGYKWKEVVVDIEQPLHDQPLSGTTYTQPSMYIQRSYSDERDAANQAMAAQRAENYDNAMGLKSALYHDLPTLVTEAQVRAANAVDEYTYHLGLITESGVLDCADLGQLVNYTQRPLLRADLEQIIKERKFGQYKIVIHPDFLPYLEKELKNFG